jgi:hypothetical protein
MGFLLGVHGFADAGSGSLEEAVRGGGASADYDGDFLDRHFLEDLKGERVPLVGRQAQKDIERLPPLKAANELMKRIGSRSLAFAQTMYRLAAAVGVGHLAAGDTQEPEASGALAAMPMAIGVEEHFGGYIFRLFRRLDAPGYEGKHEGLMLSPGLRKGWSVALFEPP